jgi:hypothetical protein
MLVSQSSDLKPHLAETFSYHHADVIHYDNPIKAMDNLEEIEPAMVVFSAADFPRHWKPFIVFLRNTFSRHETIFLLLISESFSPDEAGKAEYLEVNAVLDHDLTTRRTVERIRGIITRYYQTADGRRTVRYLPSEGDRIRIAFTNPYSLAVSSGVVVDISSGGLQIRPSDTEVADGLDTHTVITNASLRLGDMLLPVRLRVVRLDETIGFEFYDLSVDDEAEISSYLSYLAERELTPGRDL